MTPDLQKTHEMLRSAALYLLEAGVRAQMAGTSAPAFPMSTVVSLAQTMLRAVVDLESVMGTGAPSPPVSTPSPTSNMDTSDLIRKFLDQVKVSTAETQRKVFEDLQKQFEKNKETNPQPEPTPTVPG